MVAICCSSVVECLIDLLDLCLVLFTVYFGLRFAIASMFLCRDFTLCLFSCDTCLIVRLVCFGFDLVLIRFDLCWLLIVLLLRALIVFVCLVVCVIGCGWWFCFGWCLVCVLLRFACLFCDALLFHLMIVGLLWLYVICSVCFICY